MDASLQHCNWVLSESALQEWNFSAPSKLFARMPFGSQERGIGEKGFIEDSQRFIISAQSSS